MYDINTSTYLNEVFFQHQFLMISKRIGKMLSRRRGEGICGHFAAEENRI